MKILFVAILFTSLYAADEVEIYPVNKDIAEEIHDIAMLAATVESRLRDDNADHAVQADSKEVIERIEKLIKDAEEVPPDKDGKPRSHRERQLLYLRGDRRLDSILPKNTAATDPKPKDYDDGQKEEWARLSKAERHEILQIYDKDMPILWRKRIEAYFRSVNAVESKPFKK